MLDTPNPDALGAYCATHADVSAIVVCSRCGNYACTACTFARGRRRSVCRACAEGGLDDLVPWERRKELGLWRAYWQTTRLVLASPTRFFRTPSSESGFGSGLLYSAAAATVGYLGMGVLFGLFFAVAGALVGFAAPSTGQEGPGAALAGGSLVCVGLAYPFMMLVQAPFYGLMSSLVAAGINHLGLHLLKARRASFEETWRATAYANASYVLWWIPFFGWLITPFWVPVSEVIALREVHRAPGDRVALIVVGWRVVLTVVTLGGYALFLFLAFYGGSATQ